MGGVRSKLCSTKKRVSVCAHVWAYVDCVHVARMALCFHLYRSRSPRQSRRTFQIMWWMGSARKRCRADLRITGPRSSELLDATVEKGQQRGMNARARACQDLAATAQMDGTNGDKDLHRFLLAPPRPRRVSRPCPAPSACNASRGLVVACGEQVGVLIGSLCLTSSAPSGKRSHRKLRVGSVVYLDAQRRM